MTKQELLNAINEIANKMSDLVTDIDSIKEDARRIERLIENIPDDPNEIEDDNKEADE